MMDLLLIRRMMMIRQSGEPTPPANQIWYDADSQVTLYISINVVSHTFADGRGVITFGSDITEVLAWLSNIADITMVYFPSGITSIVSSAFYGCRNLALTSLPSGITSIGHNAFYGCSNLALTSLPSGITIINGNVFYKCRSLALTSLPSGITKINSNAFYGCSNLALTSLPSGITSIGHNVFYGCTGISSLTIPIVTPPTCTTSSFDETTFPIYVPAESVEAYKAADGWSTYASRIYPIT